jgi:deazaflavin-dependent oxidoreductase (nitroreductase family)
MAAMTNQIDVNEMNREVIAQFRAHGGKNVTGRFADTDLLLLHHRGAKTGQVRVNPLMYLMDGDRYIVFASRNGGPKHPHWYHNLVANPDVEVEVGTQKFAARAVLTSGADRERVWARCVAVRPFLADHAARAKPRQIPIIALEPK